MDSTEYNTLAKKEINNYLKITKDLGKNEKIKSIREQMKYYLNTLEVESYVPLYLKNFNKISTSDNFTPSFITNVPSGKQKKLYIETKHNQNCLLFFEFYLEDKTKDINFEVNKYDTKTDSFTQVYKEDNVSNTLKFLVFSNGYSLYEIIFNNDYSWFTSKDINYKVSLLKSLPSEAKKKGKFYFNLDGKDCYVNNEELVKKMKNKEEQKDLNIPVILYLNNLRIASIVKNEKGKEEIHFTEKTEKFSGLLLIGENIGRSKKVFYSDRGSRIL
jgi:glycerophosphoryl diester phosphodiesterase